jgi:hypothetical protein
MPTGFEIFDQMRDSGYTGAEAKAAIIEHLGFTPTKEEMSLSKEKLNEMKAERATIKKAYERGPSIFNPPEPFDFVEDVLSPVAEVAAKGVGFVKGTATDVFPGRGAPGQAISRKKEVYDAFLHTKKELEGQRVARITEDFTDNWRKSVAQLSEGTLALGAQLLDLGEKEEGFLEGVGRAYEEGTKMPGELLVGGAAFTAHMVQHPLDTFRTHPAEALLTVMPMIPAIAKAAKRGHVGAIRALKEMESKGIVRGTAAKVTRKALEVPQQIADIPIGPLKKRAPVVEVMAEAGPVLSGGAKALTFGDLLKSSLKGAAVGLMVDEAAIAAALAPAVKTLGAVARNKGVNTSTLRRLFTDVAAVDNARAEALLRNAILEPDLFTKDLVRLADELPELFDLIDSRVRIGAPEPKRVGSVDIEYGSGMVDKALAAQQEGMKARLKATGVRPMVARMPPEVAKVLEKMEVVLKRGQAPSRKGAPRGAQIDLTSRYLTQIQEILTGDSIALLNDSKVYDAVLAKLVRFGDRPKGAGEKLRYAMKQWDEGRQPIVVIRLKGADGKWKDWRLESLVQKAVAESPGAQKSVLNRAVALIAREETRNHRARIVADTANPLLGLYHEGWVKPEGGKKGFARMVAEKPALFHDIWAKAYELEKGLVDGAPVMFMPFKDMPPSKLRSQLDANIDGVVARIIKDHPTLSPKKVAREVEALSDRFFKFKKVDELGGHLDPRAQGAFKLIDDSENFRNDISKTFRGNASKWTTRMKKNLTVYNISSGINNITANLLIQSISRGRPLPAVIADLAAAGMEHRAYKAKALTDPTANRMYRSIEKTGALDSDMIAVETLLYKGDKGGRLGKAKDKLAKAFEGFYRQGDALPKLEESVRTYKRVMSELDTLKPGESASIMVDSNTVIPIRRGPDGQFYRKGQKRPMTPDELSDIVGRGATMAAENKFFNYGDTGAIVRWLRSTPLTIFSPFYTWFSKALAGRRGGLVGNVLKGEFSPIVHTDSAAIIGRQLADATAQSGRRAVFSQAGNIEDRAIKDSLRPVSSFYGQDASAMWLGEQGKEGVIPVKDLKYVEFSGPFDIGMRAATGLLALARGDTDAKELLRLQTEGKTPEDKRRLALAIKQVRGERLNWKDTMELAALAGNPALELVAALQADMKDKYGYGRTYDEIIAKFGAAFVGGTLSKAAQTAMAVGAERGVGPIPAGVSPDPARKETAMRFAVRRIIGVLPRPVRFFSKRKSTVKATKSGIKMGKSKIVEKGSADWYLENLEKNLKKGTSGALRLLAKKLKKFKTPEKDAQARDALIEAKDWDKVIKREVAREKANLKHTEGLLQKRSKKAQ